MNWMKKVAVALVCLLPLGLQAAKIDTLQVKSPSLRLFSCLGAGGPSIFVRGRIHCS